MLRGVFLEQEGEEEELVELVGLVWDYLLRGVVLKAAGDKHQQA